ncbi:MAG: amidohydrolase, partial [Candidatus Omnitrophica bacterium]|nr:amidohydrolase [Candidatus Omnitrophota bacterium]MBU1996631.1 amidohydrolase [Candidatus Omnitrophota bacterium]
MNNIIDCHSHYMPKEVAQNTAFFKVAWSDVDRQLSAMDSNGIDKALLLYPTSDAHLKMNGWKNVCKIYNAEIAKVAKENNDRFIGAGIIPGDNEKDIIEELKSIHDLGFKVVSVASSYSGRYLDDEMYDCLFEYASKNDVCLHIHPQIINPIGEERVKDPLLSPVLEYVFDVSMSLGKLMMSGALLKYSDVKLIFAHYGGVLPFVAERFDNTYLMLRRRDFVKDLTKLPSQYFSNLYFDSSGCKSAGALACMLEVVEADHILFGSDYPANQNIQRSIEVIMEAQISDDQRSSI